ncbi:hypothetical protein [Thiococcus pfennigii]|uniref:hypothetical protein n=1 Tax=Thiococcus pfennigii TaxID=1057 RepID=UPI0019031FAB|nr:hypothetical protein [Thiococcus pfennigii]MBK1732759.1 hypothetical protein [Thiococcus pfennigii]
MALGSEQQKASDVKAAFGARNRNRLIGEYFKNTGQSVTPENAWEHVYRLLLWIDQTIGLAHCYESDKCQPGKNWYGRALAFHDWVSASLRATPHGVADEIDWLFKRATDDLAKEVLSKAARTAAAASRQRENYEGRGFPKPGEDPDLVSIAKDVLKDYIQEDPPENVWLEFVQKVRQHVTLENKRKNLVGEGFEDVLAHVIGRACPGGDVQVMARKLLQEIPGFARAKRADKPNKIDLAVLRPGMRTIVSVKWSVRADREKQFAAEFSEYVTAESEGKPFEYVFVTNEFDPARLMRACEKLASNAYMFSHVVHVNTDAVRATYGDAREETMRRVLRYIEDGRLISLEQWLKILCPQSEGRHR